MSPRSAKPLARPVAGQKRGRGHGRTLGRFPTEPETMHTLRGIAVSSGIAIGPARVIDPLGQRLPLRNVAPDGIAAEFERLDRGLAYAREEAEEAEAEAATSLGPQYADILAAHAQMIADPTLRRDSRFLIETERISAEHAVCEVLDAHAARLEASTDSYLAARAADVRDIRQRVVDRLMGELPSIGDAETRRAERASGARPLSERDRGARSEACPRIRHRGRGEGEPYGDRGRGLEIPAVVGLGRFLDQARMQGPS